MEVVGRTAIVTGAAAGIGAALSRALIGAGASVVLADVSADVVPLARELGDRAFGLQADVADAGDIERLLNAATSHFTAPELYFANAGIAGTSGLAASEQDWDHALDVNLRAHIRAARILVPRWLEQGGGYFVSTASAAGLLTQIGSATYTVSKHAAVAFAEWLSITYGDRGVRASCLCPMGVETALLYAGRDSGDALGEAATNAVLSAGAVLSAEEVADAVLAAVAAEQFLILPHPQVLDMMRQKTSDHERWLRGMRRYQAGLLGATTPTREDNP